MHKIISQIIPLLHVSTLSCHPQTALIITCQVTLVFQTQLSVIQLQIRIFQTGFMHIPSIAVELLKL